MAIIRKWQIWAKKGNFCKNGEYANKWSRILPNIQMKKQKGASWQMAIIRKWQQVWQKLKHDDKRGMSLKVGFTKMTRFAKVANLARIPQRSCKNLNETTKETYWQLSIFKKMANLRKWAIRKNPWRVWQKLKRGEKEESLQMAMIRKWQI